jgi:hypothetical protein
MADQVAGKFITKVWSVQPTINNTVSIVIETKEDGRYALQFNAADAESAAAQMLMYLPPAPGEQLIMHVPDNLPEKADVTEVNVAAPSAEESMFLMKFNFPGGPFEMRMSHQEVLRWHRRLTGEIAKHHKRTNNWLPRAFNPR